MRQNTVLFALAGLFIFAHSAEAGVKGTVSLSGKAPDAKAIDMSSDPKCKQLNPNAKDDSLIVAGGKVKNVFVYVKNAPDGKYKPGADVNLDQKGCHYEPKVFGMMTKQKLVILNSDPTLHNVHAHSKRSEFNQAMPKQGMKLPPKVFKKEEVMVPIKCDVHGWMAAYVGVLEHPYFAVTDASGAFEITGEPALKDGEYDVVFWHETLGEKTVKVKVAGGSGTADLAYSK